MPMTPTAKKALSTTIRSLRERLLTDLHNATESAWRLATRLLRNDGLFSLYAGFGARFVHLSIWGTCLITIYEELKRVCKKRPPQSLLIRTLTGSSPGLPGPQSSGR